MDCWPVESIKAADQERLNLFHVVWEQVGGEDGCDREGGDEPPQERVRIGLRHWSEDMALDTREGKERKKTGHDDDCGEDDRAAHVGGGLTNAPKLAG